nr:MAG TPA: hypothetical protein [Caudoviricetes sp.]
MQSLPAISLVNLRYLLPFLHSTPTLIIVIQSTPVSID